MYRKGYFSLCSINTQFLEEGLRSIYQIKLSGMSGKVSFYVKFIPYNELLSLGIICLLPHLKFAFVTIFQLIMSIERVQ